MLERLYRHVLLADRLKGLLDEVKLVDYLEEIGVLSVGALLLQAGEDLAEGDLGALGAQITPALVEHLVLLVTLVVDRASG